MVDPEEGQAPENAARLRARVRRRDTYGLVLALIAVAYVLMAFLEDSPWSRPILAVAIGAVLILSLYASNTHGAIIRVAVLVTLVAVIASMVQAVRGGHGALGAAAGYGMFVLLLISPIAIIARIIQHPVVNLETVLGAICAYLLLGMLFAGLYRAADAMSPGPFFAETTAPTPVQYLYFSFVTLTTVGFGDLTAATDPGRVMVTFEALIGQVFLVTFLASLVGSYGQRRRRPRRGAERSANSENLELDDPEG